MRRYRNLIILTLSVFLLTGTVIAKESLRQLTKEGEEKFEILDKDLIEKIIQFPLDTKPIEDFYAKKRGKTDFSLGRLTFSPTGDKIAFSVNNDSIWIVKSNGAGLHCLTCDLENTHSPYWSKDGNLITFIETSDKESDVTSGIYMTMKPDGSKKTVIGSFNIRRPNNKLFPPWYYSTNGQYLLRPSTKPMEHNVYIQRVKDGKLIATYETRASILDMAWFPNSLEALLEEFKGHGESKLAVFSLTGKKETILPIGRMNMESAIHPSGHLIAYFNEYENTLNFLTKDGKKKIPVIKMLKTSINEMIWTQRGDTLAFSSKNQIYLVTLKRIP